MANIIENYISTSEALIDTISRYAPTNWNQYDKTNGDLDMVYVNSITSQGYDIKINGRVCNIIRNPSEPTKIKKMHADLVSGISYVATMKTSNPSDDYINSDPCNIEDVEAKMIFYLNRTYNLNIASA